MMTEYYAQFGEDKILNGIFSKKRGTAVEVGGFDGITGSNSYFFERLGWRTLVVEPNPLLANRIRENRSTLVAECAVGDCDGEVTLNVPAGGETLASVANDAWQRRRMEQAGGVQSIRVKQRRLDAVLEEAAVSSIDFLTIDVEGYELPVLKGFDLNRWNPRIVILEDNSSGRNEEIPLYMERLGYLRFKSTGCNDWYAKNNDNLITMYSLISTEFVKTLKGIKHVILSAFRRVLRSRAQQQSQ
jgi:FkbM family methyltransferase